MAMMECAACHSPTSPSRASSLRSSLRDPGQRLRSAACELSGQEGMAFLGTRTPSTSLPAYPALSRHPQCAVTHGGNSRAACQGSTDERKTQERLTSSWLVTLWTRLSIAETESLRRSCSWRRSSSRTALRAASRRREIVALWTW